METNFTLEFGQFVMVASENFKGLITVSSHDNELYLLSNNEEMDNAKDEPTEFGVTIPEELKYKTALCHKRNNLTFALDVILHFAVYKGWIERHATGEDDYEGYLMIGELNESLSGEAVAAKKKAKKKLAAEPDGLISALYSQDNIYTGFHSYHHSHGLAYNKPVKAYSGYRMGIELEIEAKNDSYKREITSRKSNWISMENDSSLGTYGIELVTIPLVPKDAKSIDMWRPLCEYLAKRAKSWDTSRCGLHVHIGKEAFGKTPEEISETTGKLLYLYHHYLHDTSVNNKIYGRSTSYHEESGKTEVGNAVKTLGSQILKDKTLSKKLDESLKERAGSSRYFDINLKNANTIEFRKGRGSLNVNRIVSIITYNDMMVKYARKTSWTKISYEDFVAFIKKNTPKHSPLLAYFPSSETEL